MKHFTFIIALCIFAAGCGKNVPLSGKVTFSDDGSPVPSGLVILDDGQHAARAPIQADGKFVVGFEKESNGLPPGTYGVSVVAVKILDNPDNVYPPPQEELIDLKYNNKDTSGLSITVDKSTKKFDISVDRFKK
jgi:hypothetical protein